MKLSTRPWVAQATLASPLGRLLLAATARGLGGVWFDGQAHHPGPIAAPEQPDHPVLEQARRELEGYWLDARQARFTVLFDLAGTAFQQAVWAALCEIEPGSHASYSQVAQRIGRPQAVRAVGAAIGRNPVSILVPCHRVLGQGGGLTGYAGGLPRKAELLRREGHAAASVQPTRTETAVLQRPLPLPAAPPTMRR